MKSEKTVMLVQMNIIKGGIIMALCLHHSFTDGNGTFAIAKIWAAYCRNDGSRLVTQEMVNRERLMRGWGSASLDDIAGYEMGQTEVTSSRGILTYIHTIVSSWVTARLRRWTSITVARETEGDALLQDEGGMFFFAKSKLAKLKNMASAKEHEDGDAWISTNDALCALISCCIASARDTQRRTMTDKHWSFWVAVNARRLLHPPLPTDFIGNALSLIKISTPSQSVESTPTKMAQTAYLIRDQIRQLDEQHIRKTIAALVSVGDLARVIPVPLSSCEDGLRFSSWASQRLYDINWGDAVGARIERVRAFFDWANFRICIILPELGAPGFAGEDCGQEVYLYGFERGLLGRLQQDELFMNFAQWRCN